MTSELMSRSALAFDPAALRNTEPPVALTPVMSPTEVVMVMIFSPFAVSAILTPPVPLFTTATESIVVSRSTVPPARIPSALTPVRSVPLSSSTVPPVSRTRVLTFDRVTDCRLISAPSVRPNSSVPAVNRLNSVSLKSSAPAMPPRPIVSDVRDCRKVRLPAVLKSPTNLTSASVTSIVPPPVDETSPGPVVSSSPPPSSSLSASMKMSPFAVCTNFSINISSAEERVMLPFPVARIPAPPPEDGIVNFEPLTSASISILPSTVEISSGSKLPRPAIKIFPPVVVIWSLLSAVGNCTGFASDPISPLVPSMSIKLVVERSANVLSPLVTVSVPPLPKLRLISIVPVPPVARAMAEPSSSSVMVPEELISISSEDSGEVAVRKVIVPDAAPSVVPKRITSAA